MAARISCRSSGLALTAEKPSPISVNTPWLGRSLPRVRVPSSISEAATKKPMPVANTAGQP